MRKIIVLIAALLILAVLVLKTKPESPKLSIGDKATINLEVADTAKKKEQGYSNHPSIGYDEGLLFVFDQSAIYPFWMKDMLFDLDFIIIRDNKIVELIENVSAPTNYNGQIKYVIAKKPFDKMLEVRAGFIQKYRIQIGDAVDWTF